MSAGPQFVYDVFISYSHEDQQWVVEELLPRLRNAGLKVCIDSESYRSGEPFEIGKPIDRAIEQAIETSRRVLCVFTPAYRQSEWCELEQSITTASDPAARRLRLVPILLERCDLPPGIKRLLHANFARPDSCDQAWDRLFSGFGLESTELIPEEKAWGTAAAPVDAGEEEEGSALQSKQPEKGAADSRAFRTEAHGTDQYTPEDLYLPTEAFSHHIVNLLEEDRTIRLKRYMRSAVALFLGKADRLMGAGDSQIRDSQSTIFIPILDNLAALGACAIRYSHSELLPDLRSVLYTLCKKAQTVGFPQAQDPSVHSGSSWVWKEVVARVYALGALLVRETQYMSMPVLIRQPIDWDGYYARCFWARYFLIMLSRQGWLEGKSLCKLAAAYVESTPFLSDFFLSDSDDIMAGVCQFDFVQCIHVMAEGKEPYPSFGIYHNHRTEPIISELICGEARGAIPEISDDQLADMIRYLDVEAGREFRGFNGWLTGAWYDEAISEFLAEHSPQARS